MPPVSPKITLEKGKEKDGNRRREKGGKEKKNAMAAFLVFKLSSLKIAFERKKTA